jgi:peroxiredoxin (alkyl hydroperoxide reductase subunit C)
MSIQVGRAAPDFTASAFHQGTSKQVKLSDYKGKWVMLCFYPADFTCV